MLKDVIEALKHISLTHKGIYTFKYQGDDLFNAQNNYKGYQVYVDDISLHQLNITTGIFKVEFQVYVLGHPTGESGNTVLDVQNNAYRGILSVYDYSILTISHFTDDNAAGIKLSLVLQMPSPLNLCELDENFDDEEHEEEPDHEIDVPDNEVGDIDITPIHLSKNRNC